MASLASSSSPWRKWLTLPAMLLLVGRAAADRWIQGGPGESCEEACLRLSPAMICKEAPESWPTSQAALRAITARLGHGGECRSFVDGVSPYDPAITHGYCGWHKFVEDVRHFCWAVPPKGTQRICHCLPASPQELAFARRPFEHHAAGAAKVGCHLYGCGGPYSPHRRCQCNFLCKGHGNCCEDFEDVCQKEAKLAPGAPGASSAGPTAPPGQFAGVGTDAWCEQNTTSDGSLAHLWPYRGFGATFPVKVMTYNIFWWNLFGLRRSDHGSAGKLIRRSELAAPIDLIGFQECEDPRWVMGDAQLNNDFTMFQGQMAVCIAFRSEPWVLLAHGEADVAEDGAWVASQYFGKRMGLWVRLQHKASGATVFFLNHHGPLPISSGGRCGGLSTASNLLDIIKKNAQEGDAIIVVGDFNACPDSLTVKMMERRLLRAYSGRSFDGIDHFFTNLEQRLVGARDNLGGGGSDHDALAVTFHVPHPLTTTTTTTTLAPETTVAPATTTLTNDTAVNTTGVINVTGANETAGNAMKVTSEVEIGSANTTNSSSEDVTSTTTTSTTTQALGEEVDFQAMPRSQQYRAVQETFNSLDSNGDGTLTMEELVQGLMSAGVQQVPDNIKDIVDADDTDKSGDIDFAEFLAATLDKLPNATSSSPSNETVNGTNATDATNATDNTTRVTESTGNSADNATDTNATGAANNATIATTLTTSTTIKDDHVNVTDAPLTPVAKPQVTFWKVVYKGWLQVRVARSFRAKALGGKKQGAVVRGRQEGNWVHLEEERGYLPAVDSDGAATLQQVPVTQFDGDWQYIEDGHTATASILDGRLTWPDGAVSEMDVEDAESFSLEVGAAVRHAALVGPASLRWSDGEVWSRKVTSIFT